MEKNMFRKMLGVLLGLMITISVYANIGELNAPQFSVAKGPSGGPGTASYGPLTAEYLPFPSATTIGGIESKTCPGGDFVSTISTLGVVSCTTPAGGGTVTAVSIAASNGFTGTSSGGATPALTIIASGCTGVCKSNGTAISTASSGTDYSLGTSGLATGILKSTTATGALTIAVAGDFPTLNQNTTGTASNVSGTPALPNGTTATTQAASDNSTKLATTAYADNASSNASVLAKALTGFSAGAGVVAATDTILQAFNKLAGNQAGFLPTAGTGLVEALPGHIETAANKTYVLDQYAMYAYTVNAIDVQTASGTITAALKINGTNVTTCNGIAVTSTPGLTTCTAANSVVVGDQLTLVTSANAAALDLSFTVKVTR